MKGGLAKLVKKQSKEPRHLVKNDLKGRLWKLFKFLVPYIILLFVVYLFFYPVFLKKYLPLPADFIVGVYYPWLDYKWGFSVGVPVKNPITSDVVSLIFPEQMLAIDLLKSGQWPLWNSHILSGTPLLANLQSAPFSPTNIFYFIFDKLTAWSIQIVFQHLLAALFTYVLLRYWKVSKFGSIFGAIAFAFSGFNLIFSQWNGHALSAAFIPLILFFQDRWIKDGKPLYGLGAAVTLCLQFFAGYPQITVYTLIAMAILWAVRFACSKTFFLRSIIFGVFSGLGFGLAGVQLLPAVELLHLSQRSYEPYPYDWSFLPWVKVITFFAPDYFGNHVTANYWGPQDYTSNTGFVGVVAIILMLLTVTFLKEKKEILYLTILAIISLILSFPTPIAVFLWQHNIVSMGAASAHRALVLFNFSVALLAGMSIDYFVRIKKVKLYWMLFIPCVVVGGFLIVTLYFFTQTHGTKAELFLGIPRYSVGLKNLFLPVALLLSTTLMLVASLYSMRFRKLSPILLLVLSVFELFRFGWKFNPFTPRDIAFPTTPVLEFLTKQPKPFRVTGDKVVPINMLSPYGLDTPEGYETIHPLRISQFIAALNSSNFDIVPVGRYGIINNDTSPLLDLLNTKYYLTYRLDKDAKTSLTGQVSDHFTDRYSLAFQDKSVAIMESNTVLPRASMIYGWKVIQDEKGILAAMLSPDFMLKKEIILEENPPIIQDGIDSSPVVKYSAYGEQGSTINVTTKTSGLLFVSDAWYPGWKAYIDRQETKIYRANFAFRAVNIPAGEHTVRFVYLPESFYQGLRMSELSAVGLILMVLIIHVGKSKLSRYTANIQ